MTNQVANRKEQNQLVVSVANRVQKMVEDDQINIPENYSVVRLTAAISRSLSSEVLINALAARLITVRFAIS